MSLDGYPVLIKKAAGSTSLAIENLNENKIENPNKTFTDLSEQKINELIQKGDTLIIFPLVDETQKLIEDDKKTPYAFWIILRRNNGLNDVDLSS